MGHPEVFHGEFEKLACGIVAIPSDRLAQKHGEGFKDPASPRKPNKLFRQPGELNTPQLLLLLLPLRLHSRRNHPLEGMCDGF